ncbi:uncharacterized protein LOC143921151 [Arctopsyche grandis]|uniref:uncharacterized protein LOC143921151 n=1 Tax=Arctopsyche grandis TaxID=121162 RepID=UPI00406D82D0
MECRLCLYSVPAGSAVFIHGGPRSLVELIWCCCQLKVEIGDGFPDTICFSCETQLESLANFKNTCIKSDQISRLKEVEPFKIKTEEVLLDDLVWEDQTHSDSFVEYENEKILSSTINDCDIKPVVEKEIVDSHFTLKLSTYNEDNIKKKSTVIGKSNNIKNQMRKCNISRRKSLHDDRRFECDDCSKTFADKSELLLHIMKHIKRCKVCLKSFKHSSSIRRHMKSHTGENPYKCNICLKSFAQRSGFVKHANFHSNTKPYECDICSKSFASRYNITIHLDTHTGIKPYKCNVCPKSFTSKNSLRQHISFHAVLKPHKCDVCPASFPFKYMLTGHKKLHNKEHAFECDMCLKSFSYRHNLSRHMQIHTGTKPFKCNVCLKSFVRKANLLRHTQIHG